MKIKNPEFRLSAVIGCLVTMFCIGIVYLWGVFQQPVIDHYGWDVSAVTMISSAIVFFYVFGSLVGGFLQDKTSPGFVIILGAALFCLGLFLTSILSAGVPWLIYITYGVMAGMGVGFAYSGSLNCIQKWFPHRRGFATGMSVCAFGLSTVVLGPLITWMLNSFGVPNTFRLLAFTFPVLTLLAGIFVKNPSKSFAAAPDRPQAGTLQRQYETKAAVRTFMFWILAMALFFLPASYMMIIPRVKTLGLLRGLTPEATTVTVSLMGVVSAASRLVTSAASDKLGRAMTIWGMVVVNFIASLLMIFAEGWLYIVSVLLIVASYTGPSGIFPALSTDAFGTKNSGANYGLAFMFLGVSSPVFTFLSTRISASGAETGNYTASFIAAAAGCVVPLILLPLFDRSRKKHLPRDLEIARAQAE